MKNRQLILGLILCLIGVSIVFVGAYKSMNTKDKGTSIQHELAMVLIDENDTETAAESFPSASEYYLDFSKSFCVNGSQLSWDKANSKVEVISNKADKCKLYFRKNIKYSLKSAVLATNEVNKNAVDFSIDVTEGEASLNRAIDDNGYSYYFRGDVENNYVEFGTYAKDATIVSYDVSAMETTTEIKAGTPMYWRIVRINGDGTIRLIYDGTEKVANGTTKVGNIGTTVYNSNDNDLKYAGYTYEENGSQVDSTIKGVVDTWYKEQLKTNYEQYLADSIFCNDKELSSSNTSYYASYDRLLTNKTPRLTCAESDRYTLANQRLTNPIGLISADEVMMAGGSDGMISEYLATGAPFWTLTSSHFDSELYGWYVDDYGFMGNDAKVSEELFANARPVINIKADTMFTGLGTIDSPYKLVETTTE